MRHSQYVLGPGGEKGVSRGWPQLLRPRPLRLGPARAPNTIERARKPISATQSTHRDTCRAPPTSKGPPDVAGNVMCGWVTSGPGSLVRKKMSSRACPCPLGFATPATSGRWYRRGQSPFSVRPCATHGMKKKCGVYVCGDGTISSDHTTNGAISLL